MEDDRPIGKITGIEVGHDFEGGIELSESRIHPYQPRGICCCGLNTFGPNNG